MRILYAIQGTGNGHVSRAIELVPLLRKRCETDVLLSGNQSELKLPFKPTYILNGLTFEYGKRGRINLSKTYKKVNIRRFINEINEFPIEDYDFILNDFEPVSAWASFKKKVPCIALSHQSALLDPNIPKPKKIDAFGNFVLKNYSPAIYNFGLHFSRYSKNIYTPVIRQEIRKAEKTDEGYYVVYLPAYGDEILADILSSITDTEWIIFSRNIKNPGKLNGIKVTPVDPTIFSKSLTSCRGVLCGAGFETPAEALFLGKKLMVVPIQNQFEQHYNAAALSSLGIHVLKKLNQSKIEKIKEWIDSDYKIEITYPDNTERIINKIFEMYVEGKFDASKWPKKFKMLPGKKLF